MEDQYSFDINLDFFDSSSSNIKPNVGNTALYQHDQVQPDLDIESLAIRIASVNELAIQLKATKREHAKLQKQMQDLSDSAMSIRNMYEREKTEKTKYAILSKELKEKCALAESQLTNKTLHFEQLTSQFEQSVPKGPISYNELALRYQRLALLLDEDKQLNSKEKIMLQQIQEYMEYKKLTALPAFKKRSNLKAETVATCPIVLPAKTEMHTQGTQYTRYTTTRGTNTPAKSPQKDYRTQGTQYISSMTTRGTSTSTFIKQHSIGTNFPEVVPVSIDDIFKEMICDVSPLSPMHPSPPAVTEIEFPRVKKVEMKSVSTNTGLKNVRKQIDYVPANIKYSDSRPPSRNMNDRVKSESPFMGMPTMNPFSGLGISPTPMHSTVAELWSMLGHTIFALLQNGNSQLNSIHANAVNDRLRNISADMNRRREQPRANDERMREGSDYFGEERDYPPCTKNTATSPMMDLGNRQDFRFNGAYMNSELPSPAFASVESNLKKDNPPVEIQKILLNKNVQTIAASGKKPSRVDDILQLFPQDTRSLENRKAIKRLLKASKINRKSKKTSFGSSEEGEISPVLIQTNWDLFGTSGDESKESSLSSNSQCRSTTHTLSPNVDSSQGDSSVISEMSYEPPEDDVFLGFDEDSDNLFCKPFVLPKQSRAPMANNQKQLRERKTIQKLIGGEEENTHSSINPIPLRENASKAKRKRRASKSAAKRANKLLKANANCSDANLVVPSIIKSVETASFFDLQFQRSSNFSRIVAPQRKQPSSLNLNDPTVQWHQNSEETRQVSSPLLNQFTEPMQRRPHNDQDPSNFSETTTLGKQKPAPITIHEPVRQGKSNLIQFVKSDSQFSRDMASPNSSVYNGLSLSPRVQSLKATTATRQDRSPHCEDQLNRVILSESQARSEESSIPYAKRISHFIKHKAEVEKNTVISKSPSWDTNSDSGVAESESNPSESSEEKTLQLALRAELAASREGTLSFLDRNISNSPSLSAVDQNHLIFDGFKVPEHEEPPPTAPCNEAITDSAMKSPCWDSEEETSNPAFKDRFNEIEKIKSLEEEDTKKIVVHNRMGSSSCELETPVWDTVDRDETDNTPLNITNPDQAQNQSPIPIDKFSGSTIPKEEKPSIVPLQDGNIFDSHELNADISSSGSSADLSIDCPPSPQPHDTLSLDLSLLLKTPEKKSPTPQIESPPESDNRNTSLLNKVLTSSTENLVEDFLNENSGRVEPKFQMFLSKIMDEVAPPLSPISVMATSENPPHSGTESSCDEDGFKQPRRHKVNRPATAAIAVKRSARLKAKIDTDTRKSLPLLNIPGIELGKYTKRKSNQRTPLKKPKAELKKEKAENKVDIIDNIRLGFFKDLMEEHDSPTERLVHEEAKPAAEQIFKNVTYQQAAYGNASPPIVLEPVTSQNLENKPKHEPICKQTPEIINLEIAVNSERLSKLDSYQDEPSASSSALQAGPHAPLFVGQILERTKEGSWQPQTSDPICFDECPASPPPEDQTPDESHVTRQCAESAPLLETPTSNLSVLSHIIANYNPNYQKLVKPPYQTKTFNELQSIVINYINGLCLISDTVRTADTLSRMTTSKKLVADALVSIAKTAPRPETEMPPPVPDQCISQTLNKLLCLVEQLHLQLPGIRNSIQVAIEQSLFSFAKDIIPLEFLMNLTQFYLAIIGADPRATTNPARLFICKCLYFYNQKATPLIYQTLCVFPSVLPKRDDATYDRSDALISAIQCVLMSTFYDLEKTDLKTKQMLNKLRNFYNYESFKPPRDEFLENLIAKIRAGRIKNVSYSFALICKRMDQRNTEKAVLAERLLPLANEYYEAIGQTRENDPKIACILESISFIIKPFTVETDISTYINLFGRFLNASDRQIIQEAALAAVLRTIRFGYVNCFNAIYNFRPSYELTDETKAMLRSFVYKKTLFFLKRLEHQAHMLAPT